MLLRDLRITRRLLFWQPRLLSVCLQATGRGTPLKRLMLALVRSGDVVLDVGANAGYYTRLLSDLVKTTGRVHAFEPVPAAFLELRRLIDEQVGRSNVELNQVACSEEEGPISIYVPGGDHRQASLIRHDMGSWTSDDPVHCISSSAIRVDDYLTRRDIKRCDFVKCDVEGAELKVLRGMETSILQFQPLMVLEIRSDWTKQFQYHPNDLREFLRSFGYDAFYKVDDQLSDVSAPEHRFEADVSSDMLCAVRSKHAERLQVLRVRK